MVSHSSSGVRDAEQDRWSGGHARTTPISAGNSLGLAHRFPDRALNPPKQWDVARRRLVLLRAQYEPEVPLRSSQWQTALL